MNYTKKADGSETVTVSFRLTRQFSKEEIDRVISDLKSKGKPHHTRAVQAALRNCWLFSPAVWWEIKSDKSEWGA